MLNFSGTTKRRNVNLRSSKRASKNDLIENARLERERRAKEKRARDAAILIQKYIRSWQTKKCLFRNINLEGLKDSSYGLLLAFSPTLFHFISVDNVKLLIENCQVNTSTIYWKLNQLLGIVPEYGVDIGILNVLLDKLNSTSFDVHSIRSVGEGEDNESVIKHRVKKLVDSRLAIIRCTKEELEMDFIRALLKVVPRDLKVMDRETPYWSSLLTIELDSVATRQNLELFLKAVLERIDPAIIRFEEVPPMDTIYYLIYLLSGTSGDASNRLCEIIALQIDRDPLFKFEEKHEFFRYVENLYSYKVAGTLCEYFRTKSVAKASRYANALLRRAPSSRNSEVILLGLVADFIAMNLLIGECVEKGTNDGQEFILLVDCLDMYLSYVSDSVLLGPKSSFATNAVIKFCKIARLKVIDFLLLPTSDYDKHQLHRLLSLLQKLQIRNSRTPFLEKEDGSNFWLIDNATVLRCDITSLVIAFDEFYRNEMDELMDSENNLNDPRMIDKTQWEKIVKAKFFTKKLSNSNWGSLASRKFDVLLRAPFLLPFNDRVSYFEKLIQQDRERLQSRLEGSPMMRFTNFYFPNARRRSATISRENVLEDAFAAYNPIGEAFKEQLAVTFVNEFGPEAGIDGGGITKEFLTSVSDQGFNNDKYGIFKTNDRYELYPSEEAVTQQQLQYLHFLGKVLGRCLYEKVLIDVHFADFFLHKLLNASKNMVCSFDNLSSYDKELHDNLNKLFVMSKEELLQLDLRMEIVDDSTKNLVQLVPNGSKVPVTDTNVRQYAMAIASYKMNSKLYRPTLYFQMGLSVIIPSHWIEMFSSTELSNLIAGEARDIDLADLKSNVSYGDYLDTDPTIRYLWEILAEFSPEERCKFIKFTTSVPRAPLLGFQMLNPKFGIRNAGSDATRLPTASTCVNLLKLPDYQNKELLRQKLLYALNSESRFDLS
ncbi:HCL099Cp [Eremothecium sinecaudum]|uniref:HECT-type E3 ubiquitin transferase n=1 Tax=Eremothecium sinecaudum TaxID=45286 RepID=A0A0X8HRE6_9SACH|nr:HCL099Cp [Eremothecium sinecaudum]AMD20052.1 HCL099Cp [Eremothecium sinecaudum]